MSLAMQRSPYASSSGVQRGAVKPSRAFASSSVSTSSSTNSSSRMAKPANSSTVRTLPQGPGPLPNRPVLKSGTVRYMTEPSRDHRTIPPRGTTFNHFNHSKTTDSPPARRKISNDSGYGSSGGKDSRSTLNNNYRYGDLGRGKSKSLSHLSQRDETDERTTSYRSITDSSSHGVGSKTYTQSHLGSKTALNGSNNSYSNTGIYRSTTHSDYKDPAKDDKNSLSKTGHSYSSEKELSNGYTAPGKNNYNVIDVEKTRKATITALPGTDMKCTRKSSLSSSNSSPSNSPTGRSSSDGLVGLRNLGNTCFMNSILQCLSHTQPLTDQLLKGSHMKNINSSSSMKGRLIQAFADLIKSMWKPGNSDAVSPHTFKTQIQRFAPRFMGYNQQDAQEFLRFLLEGLHDDLNLVKSKPKYTPCEFDDSLSDYQNAEKSWKNYLSRDNSLMTDLFVGQLKSMLKCCDCGYTSITFDPFWDLSLPIPRKSGSSSTSSSPWSGRRSSGADDSDINIRDCMQSFTREEILDGDERPTCDKCKVKRKSTKKFSIQRFPPILVLHLKRFSGFSFRSKLQSNVDFPLSKLDLAEFAADTKGRSVVYSLYAVSNHSGSTYGGHYTAYCKHPISNQWHCFNDSRVDSLSSSRVRGSQAYILFYEKVETKSSL